MLGCGRIGRLLLQKESRFIVVDEEGDTLQKEGITAVRGNPAHPDILLKAGIENARIVVVVQEVPVSTVRELAPESYIIVCAQKREEKCTEPGANIVIPTDTAVVNECIIRIKEYERQKKKENLAQVLQSGDTMAIIMHDNPDPDCISSALSLKLIAEQINVTSHLFYGGQIGYSENRLLVEILGLELISPEESPDFSSYSITAFVDHSPWDYTSIARKVNPDIVIDHHIPPEYEGRFMDVREDVGATSTILTKYLQLFNIEISSKLATALFYGLLVDTNNFRRGLCEEDIEALHILKDRIDVELLSQIERAKYSERVIINHETPDFFNVLGEAVKNMQFKDNVIFSFVGKVEYRDAVSNSADFLLKMERADIVLVYGIIKDSVYVSVRSWNEDLHVGKLLKKAFQNLGKAGGHPLSGGATIPLENLPEDFKEKIINQFLQVIHS